jgi:hypothetical protein
MQAPPITFHRVSLVLRMRFFCSRTRAEIENRPISPPNNLRESTVSVSTICPPKEASSWDSLGQGRLKISRQAFLLLPSSPVPETMADSTA